MAAHTDIIEELKALGDKDKRKVLQGFFKTGDGQYGYGDKFLGVPVPLTRSVARLHEDVSDDTVEALLHSEWHEVRLCALLIMIEKIRHADEDIHRRMYGMYLANTLWINNWDLVDLSAPRIVGGYLIQKPRDVLYRLAESSLLWDNRTAMVSTYTFIKAGDIDDTYRLAVRMMTHSHELMHKATGWMLREAGKKDMSRLRDFVYGCHADMPRTMLRYAIEKFPEKERKRILMMR